MANDMDDPLPACCSGSSLDNVEFLGQWPNIHRPSAAETQARLLGYRDALEDVLIELRRSGKQTIVQWVEQQLKQATPNPPEP